MPDDPETQIAALIGALPPAPPGWVRSAQDLPAARKAIDGLLERARAHGEERASTLADLEAALRQSGVEPRQALMDELGERLRAE
jgi:hypothetical protein